ncbi:MAG: hypothetical protein P1P88_05000 [Bacteroidales bacterium]|nr:hypothetical protein [Bacteroidales bacterium]
MKRRGRLVTCKSGKGIIYADEELVQGKYKVYLTNEKFEPVMDESGQHKKVLASAESLKLIGYVN